MPTWNFNKSQIKRAFGVIKTVKPLSGDYSVRFDGPRLTLYSADKRRYALSTAVAESVRDVADDYVSEEFYLAGDRQALLDTDLDQVSISMTDKAVTVKVESNGQKRQASLKKRTLNSRVPRIVSFPTIADSVSLPAGDFDSLLRHVACSALVKQTKTEEDMKVNQVHFYPHQSAAISNARYYGSYAELPGLSLDISIISSDIPSMRSFCSRFDDTVEVSQDKSHLYLSHGKEYCMAFSRVACKKPDFSAFDSKNTIEIQVARDQFMKSIQWANMVVEGTQRLSIRTIHEDNCHFFEFRNGTQEVSRLPVTLISGDGITADFPVKHLSTIIGSIDGDKVSLKYGFEKMPTVLELSDPDNVGPVMAKHFLQSMRER